MNDDILLFHLLKSYLETGDMILVEEMKDLSLQIIPDSYILDIDHEIHLKIKLVE